MATLAKHQLAARNSRGHGTLGFLGTNFPARGTASAAAWHGSQQGQEQKKFILGSILAMVQRGGFQAAPQ